MKTLSVKILSVQELVNQFLHLTLHFPDSTILPGHFVIVENNYPLYVMGAEKNQMELLIPPSLSHLKSNPSLVISEIQGTPFTAPEKNQFYLMTVNDIGFSACVYFLKKYRRFFNGLVLIGTESLFPFDACPSRQLISGFPPDVIAACPLLEDWGVPHRLASLSEKPGMFWGSVEELAEIWVSTAGDRRYEFFDIRGIYI